MRTAHQVWDGLSDSDNEMLANLYARWQDEKEYEDINDYLKKIQVFIPEAFKISKRPFAVTCKCSDGNVQITINSRTIKIKRIK